MKQGFPDSSVCKESTCSARDPGLIPGLGRSTGGGIGYPLQYFWASLVAQPVKTPCNEGDLGSISWLGSFPWRRERPPFQYLSLENSMDCIVQGVANSQTQLSDFHFT